ncbi:ABC transporter ATP-binding protein [Salmonella enterica subsp. enterica serovar Choleraesuis]|nr:ABC transporter ATP-binding protein [Salmonella enterica subsp. enterica serovar Choleraesuis]
MKKIFTGLALSALLTTAAQANDKLTLILDWYVNPDHAPLLVAEQIGAFNKQGLDVEIVPPSDPALPTRLVAAGRADLAITYQPQLQLFADKGLPLVRVATLINTPLDTIIALDPKIHSPADLKGKTIGYSVSGVEQATLNTMLQHVNVASDAVKLVNVNFQLTSALMAGKVDAIIGGYRNIEALELKLHGKNPQVFNVEDYGVPAYDELIVVANRDKMDAVKVKKFVAALKEGSDYLHAHPDETWKTFASQHPELNTELNKQAWQHSLPLFARDPGKLDAARYEAYEKFLLDNKLISKQVPLNDYARQL